MYWLLFGFSTELPTSQIKCYSLGQFLNEISSVGILFGTAYSLKAVGCEHLQSVRRDDFILEVNM